MVSGSVSGLYGIADSEIRPDLSMEEKVQIFLDGGASVVQIRMKNSTGKQIWGVVSRAIKQARGKALVIVNDRPDVALAAGADGVHLGEDDLPLSEVKKLVGPKMLVGATVRTLEEAQMAVSKGADYLGFGPVYTTTTKSIMVTERGISALAQVASAVSVPVVAIGGITLERISEVVVSGARAAAVVSGVLNSPSPLNQAKKMTQAFLANNSKK